MRQPLRYRKVMSDLHPPPQTRAATDARSEDPREMTLICEAARDGNIDKRAGRAAQKRLGHLNPPFQQPPMRRKTHRAAEGASEVSRRQSAFFRQPPDRN
jgi:hypothetical protein